MKIKLPFFFAILLGLSLVTAAQKEPTPEAEAFYTKAMSQINAKHVRWINSTAKETNANYLTPEDVMTKARSYGVLGKMGDGDIEALAFLVLMQASKSAQEDLKAIMAKVKSINNQKAKQREMLSKMQQQQSMTNVQLDSFKLLQNRTIALQKGNNPDTLKLVRSTTRLKTITKTDIKAMTDKLKNDLDSMSEMGEMESLRLQMAMDRRSKMMSTLSNILKKISQTADQIVQNLK
jgi:hypothetical protein